MRLCFMERTIKKIGIFHVMMVVVMLGGAWTDLWGMETKKNKTLELEKENEELLKKIDDLERNNAILRDNVELLKDNIKDPLFIDDKTNSNSSDFNLNIPTKIKNKNEHYYIFGNDAKIAAKKGIDLGIAELMHKNLIALNQKELLEQKLNLKQHEQEILTSNKYQETQIRLKKKEFKGDIDLKKAIYDDEDLRKEAAELDRRNLEQKLNLEQYEQEFLNSDNYLEEELKIGKKKIDQTQKLEKYLRSKITYVDIAKNIVTNVVNHTGSRTLDLLVEDTYTAALRPTFGLLWSYLTYYIGHNQNPYIETLEKHIGNLEKIDRSLESTTDPKIKLLLKNARNNVLRSAVNEFKEYVKNFPEGKEAQVPVSGGNGQVMKIDSINSIDLFNATFLGFAKDNKELHKELKSTIPQLRFKHLLPSEEIQNQRKEEHDLGEANQKIVNLNNELKKLSTLNEQRLTMYNKQVEKNSRLTEQNYKLSLIKGSKKLPTQENLTQEIATEGPRETSVEA
jgi:hypothetical protein